MSAPLNDTETLRVLDLWGRQRTSRSLTITEEEELDALAKRIRIPPWPPVVPPPGQPKPTITIGVPKDAEVICLDPGVGGSEV